MLTSAAAWAFGGYAPLPLRLGNECIATVSGWSECVVEYVVPSGFNAVLETVTAHVENGYFGDAEVRISGDKTFAFHLPAGPRSSAHSGRITAVSGETIRLRVVAFPQPNATLAVAASGYLVPSGAGTLAP
jgi:hypothetical protein